MGTSPDGTLLFVADDQNHRKQCTRIAVGEFQNVSRLFDAGVSGVIAPMINTMEDARAFAAYSKYPPMGERSWGSCQSELLPSIVR